MNRIFYQLCCISLLTMLALPVAGQNVADTVVIQDEWSKVTPPTKIDELQMVEVVTKPQKVNSSSSEPSVKRDKIEMTVIGGKRYKYPKRSYSKAYFDGHLSGVYGGLTNYLDASGSIYDGDDFMGLNWSRSRTISLVPFQADIALTRNNKFGVVLGLGLEYQRLYFSDKQTTIETGDKGIVVPLAINDEYDVRRSTLKHLYLTVPVLLEFQFGPNMFISAGVIGGIRLHTETKVVYDFEDEKHNDRNIGDFSMLPFKVDAAAMIGFNGIALFCNYTLTQMYEKNKGVDVYPITVGIAFTW